MSKCKVCHIHTARDPYGLCDFCNPPYDQYAPCGIRECANCNQQAARITELEQANAALREQLTAVARYFDGFAWDQFEAAREAVKEFKGGV